MGGRTGEKVVNRSCLLDCDYFFGDFMYDVLTKTSYSCSMKIDTTTVGGFAMKLSEREWTVLNVLWETGGAELGFLVNELYPHTEWNRNTVLTYLTRMESKGLVRIDKEVSPHIYYAMLDRESCQQQERQSFLKRVYSGSAGDLIAAFLKESPISSEERERLRKLLDEMEV